MQKQLVQLFSGIFPTLFVNLAYRNLTNPQVRKLRTNELETLQKAQQETILFKGFDIKTYRWGNGPKQLLLIHGWEGQAGNFSDLVEQLLQDDIYTIHAFDGPSHGFSSRGQTSLFEFTELVGQMVRSTGADHLISHSFGGVATTFALSQNPDLEIKKYALLTVPDKFSERIDDVSRRVGIAPKVQERLIQRLEQETQLDVTKLNVSEFVKKIKVKSALIIHDKNDRVIPITQSRNVHQQWPVSQFVEIEGTGHFRILRTESVLQQVLKFMQD